MKKFLKRSFGIFLFLMMFVFIGNQQAYAKEVQFGETSTFVIGSEPNIDFPKMYSYYATDVIRVGYTRNINGNLESICYSDKDGIIRTEYDKNLNPIGTKYVKVPLNIWGGFYETDNNYFVAMGEPNEEESKTKLVVKILKYDKNWKLLGEADFSGNTGNVFEGIQYPFSAGGADLEVKDNILYLYTSRTMFVHDDGLNHQSDITFAVDINTMKPIEFENQPYNSHSFNQYVKKKGDNLYFISHSDAYPRAINATMINDDGEHEKELFKFMGKTGDNYTGTKMTGFEIGKNNNLVVGSSVPHMEAVDGVTGYDYDLSQNVYLIKFNDDLSKSSVQWLTNYNPEKEHMKIYSPALLKINDDRFVVLFTEYEDNTNVNQEFVLRYMLIDSDGKILAQRAYFNMIYEHISEPVMVDNKIYWLTKDNSGEGYYWSYIPYITENTKDILLQSDEKKYLHLNDFDTPGIISYNPTDGHMLTINSDDNNIVEYCPGYIIGNGIGDSNITITNGKQTTSFPVSIYALDRSVFILDNGQNAVINIHGNLTPNDIDIKWIEGSGQYTIKDNKITISELKPGISRIQIDIHGNKKEIPIFSLDDKNKHAQMDRNNKTIYSNYVQRETNNVKAYLYKNKLYMTSDMSESEDIPEHGSAHMSIGAYGNFFDYFYKKIDIEMEIEDPNKDLVAQALIYKNELEDYGGLWYSYITLKDNKYLFNEDTIYTEELNISDIPPQEYEYNYEDVKPKLDIYYIDYKLVEGLDYNLEYYYYPERNMGEVSIVGEDPFCLYTSVYYELKQKPGFGTDKWIRDENGILYRLADGTYVTGWKVINGEWYYFNEDGYMQTGWVYTYGDWYYMNNSGQMQTGWVYTGGSWYYFNSSGQMQTEWVYTSGSWYYFNSSGQMKTGWVYTGGNWYYFNISGQMQTGWKVISGKYYYFYGDGHMAANEITPDGYYVNSDGVWL